MSTVGIKGLIIKFIVSLFNSYVQTLWQQWASEG